MIRCALYSVAALIAAGPATAQTPTLPAAKTYVDNLYHVVTTDITTETPGMRQYLTPRYAPALRELIEKANPDAEIGLIDAEPLNRQFSSQNAFAAGDLRVSI